MSEIKPALTPEEWEQAERSREHSELALLGYETAIGVGRPQARAALALYRHPFGFTRNDVTLLRKTYETIAKYEGVRVEALMELAACIDALLPPEPA